MFKKYEFNVSIYNEEDTVVEKRKEIWQDRSESVAKDMLRLAIQDMWKLDKGYWPRVELYCVNPDIKSYKEDDEHY